MQPIYSARLTSEYDEWMIRNAAKYNLRHFEYHPDHIKQQIAALQALLKAALG